MSGSIASYNLNIDGFGAFDGTGHVAVRDRNVAVFEVPDTVRLPAEMPEFPEWAEHCGRMLRVLSTSTNPCPRCGRAVVHWELEDRFAVACCKPVCGFVTYRRREVRP